MRKFSFLAVLASTILLALLATPFLLAQSAGTITDRRPLLQDEAAKLRQTHPTPALADVTIRFFGAIGVSKKLTQAQLDYFRAKGTHEYFLLRYVAEFGITPREAEVLSREGVEMTLKSHADMLKVMGVFHWAAFSDMVVSGVVSAVIGNPEGPYHTAIQIKVEEYLKNGLQTRAPTVTGLLLATGPRFHPERGDIHHVDSMGEPNLAEGEKVVVFLSQRPINLVSLLGDELGGGRGRISPAFENNYGKFADLINMIDNPQSSEIVIAYKVVNDRAVIKNRALRIKGPTDVISLSLLKSKIRRIATVQLPFR